MYEVDIKDIRTVFGKDIKVAIRRGTNDSLVADAVMVYDEYQAASLRYDSGDIFIDVGAHIGTWSILMATANPSFFVFSVEPVPENYEMIKNNIKINNLVNVIPFETTISGSSEGEESVFYTDDSTSFGKENKFVASMLGGSGKELKVKNTSLEDLLNTVPKVKVLKIDCEGCEVLGFANLSEKNMKKIEYIVGEFHAFRGMDFPIFWRLFEPYFDDLSHGLETDISSNYFRDFMFRRKRE